MKTCLLDLIRCDGETASCLGIWPVALAVLASATLVRGASDEPPPLSPPPPPAASAAPLSKGPADVVKMLDAGVNTGVIKAYIENSPGAFHLNAEEIVTLYQHRVNSDLIRAMLGKGTPPQAQDEASQQVANPAPPVQPAPEVNYAPPAVDYAPPAENVVYPAQTVYPSYQYVDTNPSYATYYPSYGSVSWGWGWPYYSYGPYYCGWPSYRYRYGGAWRGAHYAAPVHYSTPRYYSTPRSSSFASRVSFGSSRVSPSFRSVGHVGASSHFSGSIGHSGHVGASSHFSGSIGHAGHVGGASHGRR